MDVTALQEIRRPEEGTVTMDEYTIFNGGAENNKHKLGTGFLMLE